MKRKRCNTENNIIDASPGPVARARLSLGEDSTFVISNHRQLLPSIRINVDDVETTNSENVFENVGHICLCFLLICSIMKEKFDSSLLNRTKATTSFLLGLTHPMTRNTTWTYPVQHLQSHCLLPKTSYLFLPRLSPSRSIVIFPWIAMRALRESRLCYLSKSWNYKRKSIKIFQSRSIRSSKFVTNIYILWLFISCSRKWNPPYLKLILITFSIIR